MDAQLKSPREPHSLTDPRLYQVAVLSGLLFYGLTKLDLEISPAIAATILITAQLTQWLGTRLARLARFDPRSALISSLSLCLLLRTDSIWLAGIAASLAIGSKFLLRVRGKHLFNPTNFALVALLLLSDRVWVSPGQWGTAALVAFALACAGSIVVQRAARADITLTFLGVFIAIVFARALWLGDPLTIALHRLTSGALLIFAFLMISDPKTTPDSRPGRVVFAVAVAVGTAFGEFVLFVPTSLFFSLALCAPLVPLLDRWLPAERYEWAARMAATRKETKGAGYEKELIDCGARGTALGLG